MPKKFNGRVSYANVMATVAVFIALGGGAYAASSSFVGSTGTISGCVAKKGGAFRVVKSGKKCPHGSVALAFNQKGPQGLPGAPGATGGVGATGPAGPEGISGQTRWGNLTVNEGGTTVVAKVGPFTLSAQCQAGGEGRYVLTSSVDGAWLYGEDGPYPGEMKAGEEFFPADDEDYDEAFYAWAPGGTSLNAVPLHFNKEHIGSACEFQGELTQTS
ncbi:MAG TPA: hypothetical protein VMI13_11880 [Solirubrobacteraceae bacterium]|nr:hypothetical protein [Solirubrobacteraceae bacterium]